MGVQLNIKDAETVELARGLAEKLGKTVTETIRIALEEKQRRREEEIEEKLRAVMEIARESGKHWHPRTKGMTTRELIDELYDERGVPI